MTDCCTKVSVTLPHYVADHTLRHTHNHQEVSVSSIINNKLTIVDKCITSRIRELTFRSVYHVLKSRYFHPYVIFKFIFRVYFQV